MEIKRKIKKLINLLSGKTKIPSLISFKSKGNKKLTHISAFSYGNAGDSLLPVVLRDLFCEKTGIWTWLNIHVYSIINSKKIKQINKTDGLIIGGGGLFLKDTNPNNLSGWQWSCSIDNLNQIRVPIIMFAVGYNRFRDQDEFEPIFREHLNAFVRKASFIGIRNNGSIQKLQNYLDTDLKEKLVYQPCMTTLISKIYPNLEKYEEKEDFIALNCAFDRQSLRLNDENILNAIARVVKKLSSKTKIKYYAHTCSDKKILPYLNKYYVDYELIEFKNVKQIVHYYSKPKLVIGMRGHAQMIPFGCNTSILSIISHDKMQWFLDDINHPEWGVDVLDKEFEAKLLEKSVNLYDNYDKAVKEIQIQQNKLWKITNDNMNIIKEYL